MSVEEAAPRLRLFVAVEIPDRVKRAVDAAATPLQRRASDAKWTSPAQWHLTLAFLGEVDESRLAVIASAAGEVAARAGVSAARS